MDVVRFKEDDVIVASGHHMIAEVSNLADGTNNNAFIRFLNGETVERDYANLSQLVEQGLNSTFYNGTDNVTLSDLVNQDANDDSSTHSSFNGTYDRDISTARWVRRQ